jgi:NAD(P)-dependent dehydrogenase (short-subunit alcohol dehydrogenase family)
MRQPAATPAATDPFPAPSKKLAGKVALITGGTSGIGEATTSLFVSEGAYVAFTGRRVEKGERIEANLKQTGGMASYIYADHTRIADCQEAIETVIERYGRLDILFNNAGVVLHGNAEQTSEADWQLTLDLNVTAVWRMSRLAIPQMRMQGGGVIVNNASDWGLVGAAGSLAYCTSKGAVIQMTRAMALDHARENIRVNAVCPGDTFVERWVENGYFMGSGAVEREQALQESGAALPMGRVAAAEEIARAVLFLASSDSSYMTGSILIVDGGNTAR